MFSHNIKDKLIVTAFILIMDIIFYPWINAMIMSSLSQYIGIAGYIEPTFVILNWPSVFGSSFATQLFIVLHLLALVLFIIYNPYRTVSFGLQYDEEGKPISTKTGEHGTARLATYEELRKNNKSYIPQPTTDLSNKYPLKSSGLVLSSIFKDKSKKEVEVVYLDKDAHSIILGATGSGKTVSFIKPTILTLADAGESMIIHDPKGELKRDYAGYLRNVKGYDVVEMNYHDPRMGDQFNQLENVARRLKTAQENSFIAKTYETIERYLTSIISGGENLKNKIDTGKYTKMNISSADGILAIKYLRQFFVESFQDAWLSKDTNFYIYYRKERITKLALDFLKEYSIEDIQKYFEERIQYYKEYIKAITMDQSDLIDFANRKIRELQNTQNIIKNENKVTVSLLIRFFKEKREQHYILYKDDEAEANIYARSIANMMINDNSSDRNKGEKIWEDTPKALLVSIILFICRETHLPTSAHMGSVFRFMSELSASASNAPNNTKLLMDELFEAFRPDDPCRLSQTSVRIAGDRTKSSILVSAVAPIEIFSNPSVIEQGSKTSFDIKSVSKKPTAVFVLSAGRDENPVFNVLTSLFVEQTYVSLVEDTKETKTLSLPVRVNYLLDEVANMAPIPELGSKISLARSRRIRFNLVLQSFSQFDTNYKNDKKTIMENTSWFYLLTQDYETAKQISDRLGSYTAEGESQSLNSNTPDNITGGASKQKMARQLYTPDEIMRFKIGTGLAILSSEYPSKVNLLPSFDYPQEKEVQKYRIHEEAKFRPRQEVNYFVPDTSKFVESYTKYHEGDLFDQEFIRFNLNYDKNKDQTQSMGQQESYVENERNRNQGDVLSEKYANQKSIARNQALGKQRRAERQAFNDEEIKAIKVVSYKNYENQVEKYLKDEVDVDQMINSVVKTTTSLQQEAEKKRQETLKMINKKDTK